MERDSGGRARACVLRITNKSRTRKQHQKQKACAKFRTHFSGTHRTLFAEPFRICVTFAMRKRALAHFVRTHSATNSCEDAGARDAAIKSSETMTRAAKAMHIVMGGPGKYRSQLFTRLGAHVSGCLPPTRERWYAAADADAAAVSRINTPPG